MIDYNTCDKLLDLLDKGELEKLKKYIAVQRENYYLSNARKVLDKYLHRNHQSYIDCHEYDICKLLLTNGYSAYFLNSDEILSDFKKKNNTKDWDVKAKSSIVFELYEGFKKTYASVETIEKYTDIKKDKKTLIDLKTKEGIVQTFYSEEFSFAEKFLGENVEYGISLNGYKKGGVCLVKSNKGTGFILGRKDI